MGRNVQGGVIGVVGGSLCVREGPNKGKVMRWICKGGGSALSDTET